MTPEQKAAFVMAQAACCLAHIMSMTAANQACLDAGQKIAYGPAHFDAVFEKFLIADEQVTKFFKG